MFSWNLPSDPIPDRPTPDHAEFQSLFSWNLPSDLVIIFLSFLEDWSFNPCFLGTCPRTFGPGRDLITIGIVSILVFLELALGLRPSSMRCLIRPSFNPCFLGTCPRTVKSDTDALSNTSFNPCFLGTCPRTKIVEFKPPFSVSFNPCFLGTCPRTSGPEPIRYRLQVSILVFLELALGLYDTDRPVNLLTWFQSLFSWNLPSDSHPRYQGHVLLEVSILVFLELALGPWKVMSLPRNQHVSILVFLELALGPMDRIDALQHQDGVSILVFLELALGHARGSLSTL